jgi:hypothetical protein
MALVWLEVKIGIDSTTYSDFILHFAREIINEFQEDKINRFHFLNESRDGFFLLRIRADEEIIEKEIKPKVNEKSQNLNVKKNEISLEYPEQEKAQFGPNGEEIAYRILQEASRSYLVRLENDEKGLNLNDKYRPIYFGHLFLNAWNFGFLQEALEHWNELTERLAFEHFRGDPNKVRDFLANFSNEQVIAFAIYRLFVMHKMNEFKH